MRRSEIGQSNPVSHLATRMAARLGGRGVGGIRTGRPPGPPAPRALLPSSALQLFAAAPQQPPGPPGRQTDPPLPATGPRSRCRCCCLIARSPPGSRRPAPPWEALTARPSRNRAKVAGRAGRWRARPPCRAGQSAGGAAARPPAQPQPGATPPAGARTGTSPAAARGSPGLARPHAR